jgi:hypothetical protein
MALAFEQIGAAGACTAIYVTTTAQAAPSTKLANMRNARMHINSMNITLPPLLNAKLTLVIKEWTEKAANYSKQALMKSQTPPGQNAEV